MRKKALIISSAILLLLFFVAGAVLVLKTKFSADEPGGAVNSWGGHVASEIKEVGAGENSYDLNADAITRLQSAANGTVPNVTLGFYANYGVASQIDVSIYKMTDENKPMKLYLNGNEHALSWDSGSLVGKNTVSYGSILYNPGTNNATYDYYNSSATFVRGDSSSPSPGRILAGDGNMHGAFTAEAHGFWVVDLSNWSGEKIESAKIVFTPEGVNGSPKMNISILDGDYESYYKSNTKDLYDHIAGKVSTGASSDKLYYLAGPLQAAEETIDNTEYWVWQGTVNSDSRFIDFINTRKKDTFSIGLSGKPSDDTGPYINNSSLEISLGNNNPAITTSLKNTVACPPFSECQVVDRPYINQNSVAVYSATVKEADFVSQINLATIKLKVPKADYNAFGPSQEITFYFNTTEVKAPTTKDDIKSFINSVRENSKYPFGNFEPGASSVQTIITGSGSLLLSQADKNNFKALATNSKPIYIDKNKSLEINAVAENGWAFAGLFVKNCNSGSPACAISAPVETYTLEARFTEKKSCPVGNKVGSGGSVTPTISSLEIDAYQNFKITPNEGYAVSHVYATNAEYSGLMTDFGNVGSFSCDCGVANYGQGCYHSVEFKKTSPSVDSNNNQQYKLTVNIDSGSGTISSPDDLSQINSGATVSVTAQAKSGYCLDSFTVGGGVTDRYLSDYCETSVVEDFTITSDQVVSFKLRKDEPAANKTSFMITLDAPFDCHFLQGSEKRQLIFKKEDFPAKTTVTCDNFEYPLISSWSSDEPFMDVFEQKGLLSKENRRYELTSTFKQVRDHKITIKNTLGFTSGPRASSATNPSNAPGIGSTSSSAPAASTTSGATGGQTASSAPPTGTSSSGKTSSGSSSSTTPSTSTSSGTAAASSDKASSDQSSNENPVPVDQNYGILNTNKGDESTIDDPYTVVTQKQGDQKSEDNVLKKTYGNVSSAVSGILDDFKTGLVLIWGNFISLVFEKH